MQSLLGLFRIKSKVLMQVDVHGLKEDQVVRRYIELPKLFDLLLHKQLFFPTLQTLTSLDPFECGMSVDREWKKMGRCELEKRAMELLQMVPERLLTGDRVEDFERYQRLVKANSLSSLRKHVAELQMVLFKKRIVCSCWHADNAESDAMWRIYSKGGGVMIESTVRRLKEALMGEYSSIICSPNPQDYSIAPVRYETPAGLTKLPRFYAERPWLLKRRSFAHEKEVRISHQLPWVIGAQSGGMLIRAKPEVLISSIVISPFVDEWDKYPLRCAIQSVLRQIKLDIPIQDSKHLSSPPQISPLLGQLELHALRDQMHGGWHAIKRRKDTRVFEAARQINQGLNIDGKPTQGASKR